MLKVQFCRIITVAEFIQDLVFSSSFKKDPENKPDGYLIRKTIK
jgi:hypothetical protein